MDGARPPVAPRALRALRAGRAQRGLGPSAYPRAWARGGVEVPASAGPLREIPGGVRVAPAAGLESLLQHRRPHRLRPVAQHERLLRVHVARTAPRATGPEAAEGEPRLPAPVDHHADVTGPPAPAEGELLHAVVRHPYHEEHPVEPDRGLARRVPGVGEPAEQLREAARVEVIEVEPRR